MAATILQQKIHEKKTPVALGLCPDIEKIPVKILNNFESMYGPGQMASAEALRYHACQLLDQAKDTIPAVLINMDAYLMYGAMGADVFWNIVNAAKVHGFYTIVDSRTTNGNFWKKCQIKPDAITALPYTGADCLPDLEEINAFALVRTGGEHAGDIQSLRAGDRPLYAAAAEQMVRQGASLAMENAYSLDVQELRRRFSKAFFLLINTDPADAAVAFDDYGHGAMIANYDIQYGKDIAETIKEVKKWVMVL